MRRRIGRNEPCPCGSGKKYKKCCLRRGGSTPPPAATTSDLEDVDLEDVDSGRRAGEAIRQVADNQIRDNDPPETRETFERLVATGHTEDEARELIAAVIGVEVFQIMKTEREFDKSGYVSALKKLPELPEELKD